MPLDEASLRASVQAALQNAASGTPVCPPNPDWSLACWNSAQTTTVVLVGVYAVVIFALWRTFILAPLKLIVVALHEWGHATATWMTCGSVEGMEVHSDEGGVTKSRGGNRFIILSAGYLGSALWGMAMVVSSGDKIGVQIMAGFLGISLLMTLFLAKNFILVALTIGFELLLAGFWACTLLTSFNGLEYFVLFVGVMSGLFSIYDIYDDLLSRRVNESDASMLAKHTHTSSRCWGAIWAVISLAMMGCGVYLCLVVQS